jgi:hypothetical protein
MLPYRTLPAQAIRAFVACSVFVTKNIALDQIGESRVDATETQPTPDAQIQ